MVLIHFILYVYKSFQNIIHLINLYQKINDFHNHIIHNKILPLNLLLIYQLFLILLKYYLLMVLHYNLQFFLLIFYNFLIFFSFIIQLFYELFHLLNQMFLKHYYIILFMLNKIHLLLFFLFPIKISNFKLLNHNRFILMMDKDQGKLLNLVRLMVLSYMIIEVLFYIYLTRYKNELVI